MKHINLSMTDTISNVEQTLEAMAHIPVELPTTSTMTRRDAAKVGPILTKVRGAMARMYRGNTLRVATIQNAIERVSKLKPESLDGGQQMLDDLTGCLWHCYTLVEMHGTDDAHWLESGIPCDDRNHLKPNAKRGAQGGIFYQPGKRWDRVLPDSNLPVDLQWLALEVADIFTQPARGNAEPVDYGIRSQIMGPMPQPEPIDHYTVTEWRPEIVEAGQGSGLPFEPASQALDTTDRVTALIVTELPSRATYTTEREDRHNVAVSTIRAK